MDPDHLASVETSCSACFQKRVQNFEKNVYFLSLFMTTVPNSVLVSKVLNSGKLQKTV